MPLRQGAQDDRRRPDARLVGTGRADHLVQQVAALPQPTGDTEGACAPQHQIAALRPAFGRVGQQSECGAEPVRAARRSRRRGLLGRLPQYGIRVRVPRGHRPLDVLGLLDGRCTGAGQLGGGGTMDLDAPPGRGGLVDQGPDHRVPQHRPAARPRPHEVSSCQSVQIVVELGIGTSGRPADHRGHGVIAEHGDRLQGPVLRRGQRGQLVQQQRRESGGQFTVTAPGGGRGGRGATRRVLAVRVQEGEEVERIALALGMESRGPLARQIGGEPLDTVLFRERCQTDPEHRVGVGLAGERRGE